MYTYKLYTDKSHYTACIPSSYSIIDLMVKDKQYNYKQKYVYILKTRRF